MKNFLYFWAFFKKFEMMIKIESVKSINELIYFHSNYKFVIRVFSIDISRELGRILANYNNNFLEVYENYKTLLKKVFKLNPSHSKKVDVYFHIYGLIKHFLNENQRKNLLNLIEGFRNFKIDDRAINNKFIEYLPYISDEYKRQIILSFCIDEGQKPLNLQ